MTMQFGKLHTLSLSGLVVCQELLAVSLDSGQLNTSCHLINSTQFPWSFLKGSSTTLFPVCSPKNSFCQLSLLTERVCPQDS